jgi:hypothetical protein
MEALLLLLSTNFVAFLTKKKGGWGDFAKNISTVHSTNFSNFWGNICQTFAITKLKKKKTLHGRHSTKY